MEKMSELTISDLKNFTEGKRVRVSSMEGSAISIHMDDAAMIADSESGTNGEIIMVEPDSGYKVRLDSDKIIETILGNENAITITFTNGMGGLDISIIGEKPFLIHPIQKEYGWREPVHKDFVSRYEFINRTGIFVTPEHFEYIYAMVFNETNVSADEFVNNYEEKYATCIQEVPLNGTFKHEIMDEDLSCMGLYDDIHEPNIWEIVNSLAVSYATERKSRWEVIEKYKSALQSNLDTLTKIQLLDKKPSEYRI